MHTIGTLQQEDIVSLANKVCVTTLPCKNLIMPTSIHYYKSCYFHFDSCHLMSKFHKNIFESIILDYSYIYLFTSNR